MTKSNTTVYIEMQSIVKSYAKVQREINYATKQCEHFAEKLNRLQSFVSDEWFRGYEESSRKLDYLSKERLNK
jgi:hypothetical protein